MTETKSYLPWTHAGGANECAHGFAEGIPCPDCDKAGKRVEKVRMFPVLWQGDRAFIASLQERKCPRFVPWAFVAPHERQAQHNHGQTLERLAERGGLSPTELLAVVTKRNWTQVRLGDVNALPELLGLLAAWQATQ